MKIKKWKLEDFAAKEEGNQLEDENNPEEGSEQKRTRRSSKRINLNSSEKDIFNSKKRRNAFTARKGNVHFQSRCSVRIDDTKAVELEKFSFNKENVPLDSTATPPFALKPQIQTNSKQLSMNLLPQEFYMRDALELAPLLLGKHLRSGDVILKITEVEAYRENDSASHGRFGLTARNAAMFGPPGHIYAYLCYGIHMMLNITSNKKNIPNACLIRSCEPVHGMEIIKQRRNLFCENPILLNGPGKVGMALGINLDYNHQPLYESGGIELCDGKIPKNVVCGPRVGINYATKFDVNCKYRFAIAENSWVSLPTKTLGPFATL